MTPSSQLYPPLPAARRFCEFFAFRFHWIEAPYSDGKPEWRYIDEYPVDHRPLWNKHQSPQTLIGVSFDEETPYLLVDLDRGSPYHPAADAKRFRSLFEALEDIGLHRFVLVQSSWSGGIHIYCPLPETLPSFWLAAAARISLIQSGFTVKDGWLELFPNAKPFGKVEKTAFKAHRLPLQPGSGSFLLDADCHPLTDDPDAFLDAMKCAATGQDMDILRCSIALAQEKRHTGRALRGSGEGAAAFAHDLLIQIQDGWTDYGQTNDLLRLIGTYGRIFKGLADAALADHIAGTAQTLPGYQQFCRHQHNLGQRAKDWARCVQKFYYPYGEEPQRTGTFRQMQTEGSRENPVNDSRQAEAVLRIKDAMQHLRERVTVLPQQIGALKDLLCRTIQELFRVRPSDRTLNRYREHWHPRYHPLPVLQPETPLEAPTEDPPASCPTPTAVVRENLPDGKLPEPAADKPSDVSAPPPLAMKVRQWAERGEVLQYVGEKVVYGLVYFQGSLKPKLQAIYPGELVCITGLHSSVLFYPEDEVGLLVEVCPLDFLDDWQGGVAVLAADLQLSSIHKQFLYSTVPLARRENSTNCHKESLSSPSPTSGQLSVNDQGHSESL